MKIIEKEFPNHFNHVDDIQIDNIIFKNLNYINAKNNSETTFYQSRFLKSLYTSPKPQEKYRNP